MESFSSKSVFVFGDATHTVGMVKFLRDELAMNIAGAGTYLQHQADWVREQIGEDLAGNLLVTDQFQVVARHIETLMPDLVCGTQMERHSCRKFDLPCMVIAPPTHIENHLLSYRPILGFDGADVLADEVYTTATLGMEKHLIDLFGDAGLEYENQEPEVAEVAEPAPNESAPHPLTPSPLHLAWSPEAQGMLKKVPFFVRNRVQRKIEQYATDRGAAIITIDVVQAAKEAIGG